MMNTRWNDEHEGLWTMNFDMTLFSALAGTFSQVTNWSPLEQADVLQFAGIVIAGTSGIALSSMPFRMSDASVVAPFDYTALVRLKAPGWIFQGDIPGPADYTGSIMIIACGMYLILLDDRGNI